MADELAAKAKEAIYGLVEEETGRKLGELTIVTEVVEAAPGAIKVRFTPLSAYSPTAVDLGRRIRDAAGKVEGVSSTVVECDGHMQDELVNKLVNPA
jgi:metal-sulfur cluster biosynthetic enzyme